MQIHELTNKQLNEGLGDVVKSAAKGIGAVGSAVAQPFKDIKGAYQDVKDYQQDAKVAATADKAFNAWTKYADQVAKTYTDPVKKQAYLTRQDGRYEKDLLSFVQQNLLRGLSFSTLNNRDDIMGLIKSISKATSGAVTPPPPAPKPNPYNNQLAGGQASTTVQGQSVKPGTVPNTATPQAQATAAANKPAAAKPQTTTTVQGQPVKPGTVPSTATPMAQAQAAVKKPGTPPEEVKEAADPAQVKQLFLQLVQQAALAQQSVYTGSQDQQKQQPGQAQPQAGAVDPKQVAAQLSKVLAAAGVAPTALSTAGQAIMAASGGNNTVRSTGNPVVDSMLKQMGFSI